MSEKKDFDEYSNFDDRNLQSKSSAYKSNNSHQNSTKSNEEYGMEKNPLLNKIKNSSIMKKVEKFLDDNK
ncbi:hypothetical protein [Ureibacillus chungkukjangi]|uniref:Uncharacterized protein n=1 Tax=Ureibacillus chungkukjangi TaxID=1202712 RepID=A0A318TR51_9BACL|nr:hypothetical protein [Ureibacillus chungkukjangi]MCM3388441.1 hypothetical protein [Ureibacillus chungkukjangi]PYF07312.1 hypothetical protein BJ095_105102 [Ureibacillus chungkukjangi]